MRRVMEIATPLGKDVFLFHRMIACEELGRLSEFQIDLLSDRGDIDLDEIIAKNVTVSLELPEGKTRYFNGYVTRFSQTGVHGRHHLPGNCAPLVMVFNPHFRLSHLPEHDSTRYYRASF